MAVKLRLKRGGKTKQPYYRIVAADSRSPRDGRFIEEIGLYRPLDAKNEIKFDEELTRKWLNNGAIPTDTVRSLLNKSGLLKKFHEEKQAGSGK